MIWIMLFHMGFGIPVLSYFIGLGYLGVDVFIFLSAYGLYHGYNGKNLNYIAFYKKRCLRILPAYYIVMFIFFGIDCLMGKDVSFLSLLEKMSMLGFFLPFLRWNFFLWYIPAILFLYLFFPLMIKYLSQIKQKRNFILIFLSLLSINIILTYFIYNYGYNKYSLLLLIPRIFVFMIGLIWADIETKYIAKFLSEKSMLFAIGLMCIVFLFIWLVKILLPYYIQHLFMLEILPFLFALPGFFICCVLLFQKLHPICQNIVLFAGTYSLELYLLHEYLYKNAVSLANYIHLPVIFILLGIFIVCFPLAYGLHKAVNKLLFLR